MEDKNVPSLSILAGEIPPVVPVIGIADINKPAIISFLESGSDVFVVHILKLLDNRELAVCRGVCKDMRTIIDDDYFRNRMALVCPSGDGRFLILDVNEQEKVEYRHDPFGSFSTALFLGSTLGVLVIGMKTEVWIWNPILRKTKNFINPFIYNATFRKQLSGSIYRQPNQDPLLYHALEMSREYLICVLNLRIRTWSKIKLSKEAKVATAGVNLTPFELQPEFLIWQEEMRFLGFDPQRKEIFKIPFAESSTGGTVLDCNVYCWSMVGGIQKFHRYNNGDWTVKFVLPQNTIPVTVRGGFMIIKYEKGFYRLNQGEKFMNSYEGYKGIEGFKKMEGEGIVKLLFNGVPSKNYMVFREGIWWLW